MKRTLSIFLIALFVLTSSNLLSWGFFAHKRINHLSVYTLPPEMFGFYKKNVDFISEHAVDPDKRRYGVKGEAPRHYIDIDHYCEGDPDCDPFEIMPIYWSDAVEKFSRDTLEEYGIVPWHIPLMVKRLTTAFEKKDVKRILRLSAELGHYIGDAHVPLHTTKNYNGQLTNQRGIHGFWESRLPELYSEEYDFFVGQAEYIENPTKEAWKIVKASHLAVDSVLRFEAELTEQFPADKKYSYEERGRVITEVYSAEFSSAFQKRLNGQVERRMREAVKSIGSFWYTAWVNAGQPNLDDIDLNSIELLEQEIANSLDSLNRPDKIDRPHE